MSRLGSQFQRMQVGTERLNCGIPLTEETNPERFHCHQHHHRAASPPPRGTNSGVFTALAVLVLYLVQTPLRLLHPSTPLSSSERAAGTNVAAMTV